MEQEVILADQTLSVGTTIVLKDRNGNDVTYNGIETVTFDTAEEGVQATFTLGVEQTGKEVELDFSGGDQVVKADDRRLLKELTIKKPEALLPENIRNGINVGGVGGSFIGDTEESTVALSMVDGDQVIEPSADGKVLSKVVINKPETLVPENIAKGVAIAGVVGNFAGGGDVKIASGRAGSTGDELTIEHNLGVIPDIFMFNVEVNGSSGNTTMCLGFSKAFKASLPAITGYGTPWIYWAYRTSNSGWGGRDTSDLGIDTADGTVYYQIIHSATDKTVTLGSNAYKPNYGQVYWLAIGGLT